MLEHMTESADDLPARRDLETGRLRGNTRYGDFGE
jgi:hypothetical protein